MCACCLVIGGMSGAKPPDPLRGNLAELRRQVDRKFEVLGHAPAAGVKRRFKSKGPDLVKAFTDTVYRRPAAAIVGTGIGFAVAKVDAAYRKPAAAAVPTAGWTVLKFTRKGGALAGKDYFVHSDKDGAKYPSLKQAKLAGYVPDVS